MSDAVVPHKPGSTAPRMRFSPRGLFRRAAESDLFYSFRRSRITMIAAAVTAVFSCSRFSRRCFPCRIRSTPRSFN